MIDVETAQELTEFYSKLKQKFFSIDVKYSLDYVEPQLNLPESLNLTPLTFDEKSQEDLRQQALIDVQPQITEKINNYNSQKASQLTLINQKITYLSQDHADALTKLQADYNSQYTLTDAKMRRNGLIYSTVFDATKTKLVTEYNQKVQTENADYQVQVEELTAQKQNISNLFDEKIASLDSEKADLCEEQYYTLVNKQENERQKVEKYNQSLAEKETKYQASCAKAKEYAREAEYERALNVSKLYASLGETGLKAQIKNEKLYCVKFYFASLNKEEAYYCLNSDAFMRTELGSNYTDLTDWIDLTLSPAD